MSSDVSAHSRDALRVDTSSLLLSTAAYDSLSDPSCNVVGVETCSTINLSRSDDKQETVHSALIGSNRFGSYRSDERTTTRHNGVRTQPLDSMIEEQTLNYGFGDHEERPVRQHHDHSPHVKAPRTCAAGDVSLNIDPMKLYPKYTCNTPADITEEHLQLQTVERCSTKQLPRQNLSSEKQHDSLQDFNGIKRSVTRSSINRKCRAHNGRRKSTVTYSTLRYAMKPTWNYVYKAGHNRR